VLDPRRASSSIQRLCWRRALLDDGLDIFDIKTLGFFDIFVIARWLIVDCGNFGGHHPALAFQRGGKRYEAVVWTNRKSVVR
jgi:hypothetical protein